MFTKNTYTVLWLIGLFSPFTVFGAVPKKIRAAEHKGAAIGTTITLGVPLDQSGDAALIGRAFFDGLSVYFNELNAQEGGIGGKHKVTLHQHDYGGDLVRGTAAVHQLAEKTPVLFASMGDTLFQRTIMPFLSTKDMIALFPKTGLRPPLTTALRHKVFYFRPSYTQELFALVHYAINNRKKSKIAVFYEDSIWGQIGKEAVSTALQSYNLTLCGAGAYQPGTVNIRPALEKLKKSEPDVIICVADSWPSYNFIRDAINQKLHYVTFMGISRLSGIQRHLRKSRGITLIASSVVPNPHNSQLPVVKEYRKDMQHYLPNKDYTVFSLEGYITSMLCAEVLKKATMSAQGNIPTLKQIRDIFPQLHGKKFHGLSLALHDNCLSQTVWINTGQDTRWEQYLVEEKKERE